MFIIETSSHSDSLKLKKLAKKNYFDIQVGGGLDSLPHTPVTKYTKQSDKENSWISLELSFKLIHFHIQIV